eukprot:s717_g1.t1
MMSDLLNQRNSVVRSGNFDGVSRSVGVDLVSSELLLEVSEVPGGFGHLLEWYNRVLATQVIPEHWNQPVLVMLPKVAHPQLARDLRTIAMGSAVSKVFSKMLLARLKRGIAPVTPAQCASAGRQTGDYVYTLWKLMELSREWGTGFAALKLDLSKAFDSLRREPLLQKIRPLVTCQAEFACWQGLLNNVVGLLQTPWGSSSVPMDVGIKQGAPESPALFSFMAEQALLEASTEHAWSDQARVFPGLDPEEILYMDDGVLWTHDIPRLRVRVIQLQAALLKYGLRLNLAKCQLYCAPTCQGPRNMHLDGVTLADAGHLDVMGVRMRVGMTIYELVAPFAARAKEKFWEIRHILQAKGSVKARVRVMQRIIGATALWCIGAIPPDKGAQSLLNTVQLQILIWMLREVSAAVQTHGSSFALPLRLRMTALYIFLLVPLALAAGAPQGTAEHDFHIMATEEPQCGQNASADLSASHTPVMGSERACLEGPTGSLDTQPSSTTPAVDINPGNAADQLLPDQGYPREGRREQGPVHTPDYTTLPKTNEWTGAQSSQAGLMNPGSAAAGAPEVTVGASSSAADPLLHDSERGGADRRQQHPGTSHDYLIRQETEVGPQPTAQAAAFASGPSASASSRVNTPYQAVLQTLQGRGHEPLDETMEPPEELCGPMRHYRALGSRTACLWRTRALNRLHSLRQDNRGWENVWVQIVRLVLARGDDRYELFARTFLRWLREEFGNRYVRSLHGPLAPQESDFARWVERATYQDFQQAMHGGAHPAAHPDTDDELRRLREIRETREELREELGRVLRHGRIVGMRAELHHQIALYCDPAFASWVVVRLGDLVERLDATGSRHDCQHDGRQWCRWVAQVYWQHYCRLVARDNQRAHGRHARSRTRSPSRAHAGAGRERQSGADADDENSFLQVTALLLVPAIGTGQRVQHYFPEGEPAWYREGMRFAWGLYHGGAEPADLARALREGTEAFQDARFNEWALWLEGHVGQVLEGPRICYQSPRPSGVNIEGWATDLCRGLRREFIQQRFPRTMENLALEQEQRRWQIDNLVTEECYEEERMEHRDRSRSRTPQRLRRCTPRARDLVDGNELPGTSTAEAASGGLQDGLGAGTARLEEPEAASMVTTDTSRPRRSRSRPGRGSGGGEPDRRGHDTRRDDERRSSRRHVTTGGARASTTSVDRPACRADAVTEETRILRPGLRHRREPRPFSPDGRPGSSSDGAAPGTGSAATVMDIDQGVETWRYLLRMTNVWPPPP